MKQERLNKLQSRIAYKVSDEDFKAKIEDEKSTTIQRGLNIELEKGYEYVHLILWEALMFFSYLKKFKALSRAFANGDFRNISNNGKDDFLNAISKVRIFSEAYKSDVFRFLCTTNSATPMKRLYKFTRRKVTMTTSQSCIRRQWKPRQKKFVHTLLFL